MKTAIGLGIILLTFLGLYIGTRMIFTGDISPIYAYNLMIRMILGSFLFFSIGIRLLVGLPKGNSV